MNPLTETESNIFYLVRHGDSRGNITKTFLSSDEDDLSELGITQTEALGDALRDVRFTKAYCSPYIRTVQTAEIILKQNEFSKDLPYKTDARIREFDYGGFEGGPYGDVTRELAAHLKKGLDKSEFTSRGTETTPAMKLRCQSFMEDLMKDLNEDGKPETVLMVSHAALNTSFMEFLNAWDKVNVVNWDESCAKIMKNTTYMKFSISQQLNNNSKRELVLEKIHGNSHLSKFKALGPDTLTKTVASKDYDGVHECFHV